MTYKRLILGDSNVGRFWQVVQGLRPPLQTVSFSSVTCQDTLVNGLNQVSTGYDYVIVSAFTTLLLEEASQVDVAGSTRNILDGLMKHVAHSARKSSRCEVGPYVCIFFCFI